MDFACSNIKQNLIKKTGLCNFAFKDLMNAVSQVNQTLRVSGGLLYWASDGSF